METIYSASVGKWTHNLSESVRASKSFFYREVVGRVANAVLTPLGTLTHGLDTAVAGVSGALSFALLTVSPKVNHFSRHFFESTDDLFSDVFAGVVRTIDPEAEGLSNNGDKGYFAEKALRVFAAGEAAAHDESCFVRNVNARVIFLTSGVALVVARIFDTAIGVLVGAAALAALGGNREWNHDGYVHLKLPAVIGDLVEVARKVINPQAHSHADHASQWCQFSHRSVTLASI